MHIKYLQAAGENRSALSLTFGGIKKLTIAGNFGSILPKWRSRGKE